MRYTSYDLRDMLTETNNKHFSERLFYADSVSNFSHATPCYNGNISVARTLHADTTFTFVYSYDQLNRLGESELEIEGQPQPSEWFNYDARGNIIQLQRYSDNRLIDDLHFSYQQNGNQLLSIRDDGEDTDLYSTIEYHSAMQQADTTMFYDTNGNLITDADRGISVIKYNILNLPDTIQFINGGQIVNFYDAVGRKYKSITYTNIASVIPQQYDFAHYSFETDSIDYLVTEYSGNIETRYSRMDTTMRIHNAIGYYTDSTYYHFIKDHLGNVCAVVNSAADTVVQRTMYYASGVPMAESTGRDAQPYLYNGKEFVEAHGINTYDYGFRGYYASIGRFTSIDPLAEQTPWQSPYVYANNDFINKIDFMGLSGGDGFAHDPGDAFWDDGGYGLGDNDFFVFPWSWSLLGGLVDVYSCIVTDISGRIIGGVDDGDENIYIDLDGKWDPNEGKEGLIWAGEMEHSFNWYMSTSGGGGIGGSILTSKQVLNALVCAAMNGRLSITITVSLGLEVGDKFFSREGNGIGLYGNLMSFELGSITLTNSMNNPISDYSYIRKNNRIKITQGYQLIVPTYEKSFDLYASDLEYVPASRVSEYSLTWAPYLSADGDYYLNFSFGTFMSISVEIIYKNNNE